MDGREPYGGHFDISINGANVFLNIEFIESFLLLIIG